MFSPLAEILLLESELLVHSLKGSRLQFVGQRLDDRESGPKVEGAVASMAARRNLSEIKAALSGKNLDPADDRGPLHIFNIGHVCPMVKGK